MEKLKMETTKYDIFTMKSEQMKFNAFFSYLRSFSEAGLDTLHKLESEFHKQMKKYKNQKQTLTIMKNILSSYQIFILGTSEDKQKSKTAAILQKYQSLAFVSERPSLKCLKQLNGFCALGSNTQKYLEIKEQLRKQEKKNVQDAEELTVCAFCEQLIKNNPYAKDSKGKRKGVAIADGGHELRAVKKNHMQQQHHLMQFQQQVLQRYTLKQINSKRYISDPGEIDILNRKYATMKLQFSNGGNVLEQVLNEFNLKTEAIARFVNNSQIVGLEDHKMSNQIDYQHFEKDMKQRIQANLQEAHHKLKLIICNRIEALEKIKQSKMNHKDVQTDFHDVTEKEKYELKIKQLTQALKKIKSELESERALNQSLKKLLESKSVQFQEQFLNYRKQVIKHFEPRSKTMLKSLKSIRDIIEGQEEGEEELKQNVSINNIEFSKKQRLATNARIGGLLKDKEKYKKNHIRFTLQDDSNQDENNNRCGTVQSNLFDDSCNTDRLCQNTVATQTEQIYHIKKDSFNDQKFYLLQRDKDSLHSSRKVLRQKKNQSQLKKKSKAPEQSIKQWQSNLYAHVKSKVYNKVQASISTLRKEGIKKSENMSLVKKLSANCALSYCQSLESQPIQCHKLLSEPIFSLVSSLSFSVEDVYNLYLSAKNAQNYQCLLYRNSIFNKVNLNPKRAINNNQKLYASDIDWNFKKDFNTSDSVEHKVVQSIFNQLCLVKRRERCQYEQIKLILRCPNDMGNNVQLLTAENGSDNECRDIELSELKKMINIIMRLHGQCIGNEKDVVCNHLVLFCKKIGLKIC